VKTALLEKAAGEGLKTAEYNFDSYMLTGWGYMHNAARRRPVQPASWVLCLVGRDCLCWP
jgi:hypothetical protein